MTVPPDPYDNHVITVMTTMLDCLCTSLADAGLPATCVCTLYPGEGVALDYAGDCTDACGSAWVRLLTAGPAGGIGVENTEVDNCGASLGFGVEVGVARCVTTMLDDGSPAPPEELLAATQLQVADMYAMRRALVCCGEHLVLVEYAPFGPDGGVVGGIWSALLIEEP